LVDGRLVFAFVQWMFLALAIQLIQVKLSNHILLLKKKEREDISNMLSTSKTSGTSERKNKLLLIKQP
jgi:hypothetical protein